MGGSSFNKKFNAFIKTLFDNNYIFYLIAVILIGLWVSNIVINMIFSMIGWSTIAEIVYLYFSLKEESTESIIGIIGTFGMCVLYIAFCNTCYMSEYYNKNNK